MKDTVADNYWTRGFSQPENGSLVVHLAVKLICIAYLNGVRFSHWMLSLGKKKQRRIDTNGKGIVVFAIGPFFSENWSFAHMEALSKSSKVEKIYLFAPESYRPLDKLEYVQHSPQTAAWLGSGIARVLNAFRLAKTVKPDLVLGYHLPWNGLMSLLVAARTGARAVYFAVGGPPELIGGGIYSEHALFSKLTREDTGLEKRLMALVRKFDGVLTMGSRSRDYFCSFVDSVPVLPMAVGINDTRFSPDHMRAESEKEFDLIFVGRLSPIKKPDVFVRIVSKLADGNERLRAAVVGDGEELDRLRNLANTLGMAPNIRFFGWINDVDVVLNQSRVLVMTSASEGLPHSLIEAMLSGVPAVAPNVGEISDLIVDDVNGYLIDGHDIGSYVSRLRALLNDSDRLRQFGTKSRARAKQYTVEARADAWNKALEELLRITP